MEGESDSERLQSVVQSHHQCTLQRRKQFIFTLLSSTNQYAMAFTQNKWVNHFHFLPEDIYFFALSPPRYHSYIAVL